MKLFQRTQRSLFGEILDWMLTPLLLLWPISLALTWLVAQNLANKPFDRALIDNAQVLAQYVQIGADHRLHFALPQPASELLRADEADNVYYQVLGAQGEFLSGARALPAPPEASLRPGEPQLRDAEYRGRRCAWPRCGCRSRVPRGRRWCRWPRRATSAACWPPKSSRA